MNMKQGIYYVVGVIVIGMLLFFNKFRGIKLDSKQIDKIKKDIRKKPLRDVIASINEWIS